MPKVYVTRFIPQPGIDLLKQKFDVINFHESDEAIEHSKLVEEMKKEQYDALYCMLTDQIDAAVLDAAGKLKNYTLFKYYLIVANVIFRTFSLECSLTYITLFLTLTLTVLTCNEYAALCCF